MGDYLEECSRKLKAGIYFFNQLKKFYVPGKLEENKEPQEVYYYTDACIFELHSAAQMMLQYINSSAGTGLLPEQVAWSNTNFQKKLKKLDPKLYKFWSDLNSDAYYHLLEAARNHLAHRGSTPLSAVVDENGVIQALAIDNGARWRKNKGKYSLNPTGKSIELLDELQAIGVMLETKLKMLKNISNISHQHLGV